MLNTSSKSTKVLWPDAQKVLEKCSRDSDTNPPKVVQ